VANIGVAARRARRQVDDLGTGRLDDALRLGAKAMGIPTKVLITLAIILGIGVGTGLFMFGILTLNEYDDDQAAFVAMGSAILVASISALVAHLAGGFRDLDDREP
jgi:hypothetical protein